jgi:uncharacterized membrane protein
MRPLLALVCVALAGCGTPKKDSEPPVVVQVAATEAALQSVGKDIDQSDSRVAAAVAVVVENKDKPALVEAEGKLALSYLPAPTSGDLAYARQRAAAQDAKAYSDQMAFAKGFLAKIDADWAAAETQSKRNAADLAAALTKVNQLEAKVRTVQDEAEDRIRKVEAEASRNIWSITAAGLAVAGAVASAFLGFRTGGVLLVCAAFCGALPHIYESEAFPWVAGLTLAAVAGLGLWRLYDYVSDLNAAKADPPSPNGPPSP